MFFPKFKMMTFRVNLNVTVILCKVNATKAMYFLCLTSSFDENNLRKNECKYPNILGFQVKTQNASSRTHFSRISKLNSVHGILIVANSLC